MYDTAHPFRLEDFCIPNVDLTVARIGGKDWVVLDEELRTALGLPKTLLRFLPRNEVRRKKAAEGKGIMVTERLFFQLVLGSNADEALNFRDWVATEFLQQVVMQAGDQNAFAAADRLRSEPPAFFGSIEAVVSSEFLVDWRSITDGWE